MADYSYENEMSIILAAGDSKAESQRAIELASEGEFEEAEAAIKSAYEKMTSAHKAQMDLLRAEAAGDEMRLSILLIHSQDHLVMAQMSCEQAEMAVSLYKKIYELSK